MRTNGIEIPCKRIESFCRAHGIRRLVLFGPVLCDDFRPESDINVLVRFQPGVCVGLASVRLQDELSGILGQTVDLNTPGSISRSFRDEDLRGAEELYISA